MLIQGLGQTPAPAPVVPPAPTSTGLSRSAKIGIGALVGGVLGVCVGRAEAKKSVYKKDSTLMPASDGVVGAGLGALIGWVIP